VLDTLILFLRDDNDLGSGNQIYLPASLTPHAEKIAFRKVTYDFIDVDGQLICRVMLYAPERWIRHPIEAIPESVGDIAFTVRRNALKLRPCCDRQFARVRYGGNWIIFRSWVLAFGGGSRMSRLDTTAHYFPSA
jgi:hypothetical protein